MTIKDDKMITPITVGDIAKVIHLRRLDGIEVVEKVTAEMLANPSKYIIKPLELTAKILTDTNFDLDHELLWYHTSYGFYVRTKNEEHKINMSGNINYVHELQQILRLCGIEKEIVIQA